MTRGASGGRRRSDSATHVHIHVVPDCVSTPVPFKFIYLITEDKRGFRMGVGGGRTGLNIGHLRDLDRKNANVWRGEESFPLLVHLNPGRVQTREDPLKQEVATPTDSEHKRPCGSAPCTLKRVRHVFGTSGLVYIAYILKHLGKSFHSSVSESLAPRSVSGLPALAKPPPRSWPGKAPPTRRPSGRDTSPGRPRPRSSGTPPLRGGGGGGHADVFVGKSEEIRNLGVSLPALKDSSSVSWPT